MKMTRNDPAAEAILRMADEHKKRHEPRAPGLHVSDLIYCRVKSWYRHHIGGEEVLDPGTLALFLMGQGHHSVFQRCIPENPDTLIVADSDGTKYTLTGTPDMDWPEHVDDNVYWTIAPPVPAEFDPNWPENADVRVTRPPAEIKTTRFSAEKIPDRDIPHYVEQLASYCLSRGTSTGRLYVFHLNGGYGRSGMKPQMICYEFEFTPQELKAWSDELGWRAFQVTNGNERGGPPVASMDTHYTWECGYCPYNRMNGGPCPAPEGLGRGSGFFTAATQPVWMQPLGES